MNYRIWELQAKRIKKRHIIGKWISQPKQIKYPHIKIQAKETPFVLFICMHMQWKPWSNNTSHKSKLLFKFYGCTIKENKDIQLNKIEKKKYLELFSFGFDYAYGGCRNLGHMQLSSSQIWSKGIDRTKPWFIVTLAFIYKLVKDTNTYNV